MSSYGSRTRALWPMRHVNNSALCCLCIPMIDVEKYTPYFRTIKSGVLRVNGAQTVHSTGTNQFGTITVLLFLAPMLQGAIGLFECWWYTSILERVLIASFENAYPWKYTRKHRTQAAPCIACMTHCLQEEWQVKWFVVHKKLFLKLGPCAPPRFRLVFYQLQRLIHSREWAHDSYVCWKLLNCLERSSVQCSAHHPEATIPRTGFHGKVKSSAMNCAIRRLIARPSKKYVACSLPSLRRLTFQKLRRNLMQDLRDHFLTKWGT